jgi:hypothetical protein
LAATAALDFLVILLLLVLLNTQVAAGDIPTVQYPRVTRQVVRAAAAQVETIHKVELRLVVPQILVVAVVLDMLDPLAGQDWLSSVMLVILK